eukprot:GDKI01013008.1.p1 GENE.GDKI01013008.1~~GDKI01013008.1.p1  ORF type:complete len:456 (-),score=55.31 GDKI01013008.1:38-1405(-)
MGDDSNTISFIIMLQLSNTSRLLTARFVSRQGAVRTPALARGFCGVLRGTQIGNTALISKANRLSSWANGMKNTRVSVGNVHLESRHYHTDQMFSDGSDGPFKPHPFNRRFAYSKKPFFPIEARNLRLPGKGRRKKRMGRGDKGKLGIRERHQRGAKVHRTFEGGTTPHYRRFPKWPEAWLARQRKVLEPLNLAKLRYFIEKGRLDTRFPITQRHLRDSKCVYVKNGCRLFNVNEYPFPYKIDIEVASADQSSIDAIKRVGGSVTIVYYDRVNMRAHLKPYKFEVLPRTARPNLQMVHFLEKMRARGCKVKYIKPLWLIQEEQRVKTELAEFDAETAVAEGRGIEKKTDKTALPVDSDEESEKALIKYRLRKGYKTHRGRRLKWVQDGELGQRLENMGKESIFKGEYEGEREREGEEEDYSVDEKGDPLTPKEQRKMRMVKKLYARMERQAIQHK